MNENDTQVIEWTSASPAQTGALGRALAGVIQPMDVLALVGPLGAGKTQLVRGIAAGMGVDERLVSSPTFVLMCEYPGRVPIVHIDAYRMHGVSDLESIGWSDELLTGAVTLIEWADQIEEHLPADHLWIELEHDEAERRAVTIRPRGGWIERMDRLEGVIAGLTMVRPCTTCGQSVQESVPTFPFCSERCKLVDLNQWFGGKYRISTPANDMADPDDMV